MGKELGLCIFSSFFVLDLGFYVAHLLDIVEVTEEKIGIRGKKGGTTIQVKNGGINCNKVFSINKTVFH